MKKVVAKVKQEEEQLVEVEVLARAIIGIDDASKKLMSSGLNEKAIVLLIYEMLPNQSGYGRSGKVCGKPAVSAVLKSLKELRKTYCTV